MNEHQINENMVNGHHYDIEIDEFINSTKPVCIRKQEKKVKQVESNSKTGSLKKVAVALAITLALGGGITTINAINKEREEITKQGIEQYEDFQEYANENDIPITKENYEWFLNNAATTTEIQTSIGRGK